MEGKRGSRSEVKMGHQKHLGFESLENCPIPLRKKEAVSGMGLNLIRVREKGLPDCRKRGVHHVKK